MDIALKREVSMDLFSRIRDITDVCRVSKIEQMLSNCLENLPQDSSINYVGELNKNDIMH